MSESSWTVQKWWRVMKESVTHSAENRLCRKSRDSRLLSLVPLLLLQRIYDVVTGFAVSWIQNNFSQTVAQSAFLLHWLHCFTSVLQWADWQNPKLHAKIPAALQTKECPSCRNNEIMYLVSALHLDGRFSEEQQNPGEDVAKIPCLLSSTAEIIICI